MRAWRLMMLVVTLVCTSSIVRAQSVSSVPLEPTRGHVAIGAGIVTFPAVEPVFSGEFVEHVRPQVQAYANFSFYENVMPQALRDDLYAASVRLGVLTGDRWNLRGRDRAMTFTAGGRYVAGRGLLRPYVGGGAGFVQLKRQVTDARLGDVTAAVFNDFGIGDGDLSNDRTGVLRPLFEALGGVGAVRGNLYVDIGYRYRPAVRLSRRIDISQFSASIGYRF
jgi:hypothetical protein